MPDLNLTDLDDFLDPPKFTFTLRGKRYTVEEASGERFLRIQRYGAALAASKDASDPRAAEFANLDTETLGVLVLGPVFEKLVKANLPGSVIDRTILAAFFWHIGQGEAVIRAAFQGASPGKAPRRTAPKKAAQTTRSAAATTTRKPASGNTARSPRR